MNARHSSPQPNILERTQSLVSLRFWAVVVLTGIGAGLGAIALMALLRVVQHTAWSYESGDFVLAVDRVSAARRVSVVVVAGIVAGVGMLLVRKYTRTGPGLSSALWFHSGGLPFARSAGNAILSIVIVGLGASLGRESAPKEVGAAIASALSDRAALSLAQRRLLVACGAGAGMAAVYNVPLGGALFTLEVLLGTLSLPLFLPALVTSLIATAVAWLALPIRPAFINPPYGPTLSLIGWATVCGPILGVARQRFWQQPRKARYPHSSSCSSSRRLAAYSCRRC